MPHQRERLLQKKITTALKWSPAVGLWGLRQVGKTTLTQNVVDLFRGSYETMDSIRTLEVSRQTPEEFLTRQKLVCLDEVQKAPWLFPVMKTLIGTKRKPGSFLLTGSVRFTAKEDVRESLTGRILLFELLPFTISESHEKKPSVFLESLFNIIHKAEAEEKQFEWFLKQLRQTPVKSIVRQAHAGGLPIPCFARDEHRQYQWFQTYFETMLARDIALIDKSFLGLGYQQAFSFVQQLASFQGRDVNLSDLALRGGLRPAMAKKLLKVLETLGLVEFIPSFAYKAVKAKRKSVVEWKDSGLWCHMAGLASHRIENNVAALSLVLACEFRSQLAMMEKMITWNYYQNRDGANIPWIFSRGENSVAVSFLPLENPSAYDVRVLKNFVEDNPNGIGVLLGSPHVEPTRLAKRIWFVPFNMVF